MNDEYSYVIRGEWTGSEYHVRFDALGPRLCTRGTHLALIGVQQWNTIEFFVGPEWFWWVNFWAHWHVRRIERRAWKIYQLNERGRG